MYHNVTVISERLFRFRGMLAGILGLSTVLTLSDLRRRRSGLWLLILFCAMAITLLPTPLLEPRYFTQAVVVMVLNCPDTRDGPLDRLAANAQLWTVAVINLFVIYLFLYNPFRWHDGSIARFMF